MGAKDLCRSLERPNEMIKDEFVCEPRGMVDVKGTGQMETWFVTEPRGDAA